MAEFLLQQFGLGQDDLYQVNGPVNLVRLMGVPDQVARPELKYLPFSPGVPGVLVKRADMFEAIRKGDILLHHPFQSFRPVIAFIEQAARDPDVVAIKQTVYRTGADSELMRILIDAARRGKEITVVVELMARFDEEANINWAAQLEEVGAHVVYGVVGHKTHAKLAMVVRREERSPAALLPYRHRQLPSAHLRPVHRLRSVHRQRRGVRGRQRCVHAAHRPGQGEPPAPSVAVALHSACAARSPRSSSEAEAAKAGKKAGMVAKMNALLEPEIIAELYEASKAGVKIDLIVRGVCCLRPGIPGLSENISVRSVIGRFLEHHRVFHFVSAGSVYISSADWMDRNFFRRIEVCLPILEPKLQKRVIEEGAGEVSRGQHPGLGHEQRWPLRALQTGQGSAAQRAARVAAGARQPAAAGDLDIPLERLRPKRKAKASA